MGSDFRLRLDFCNSTDQRALTSPEPLRLLCLRGRVAWRLEAIIRSSDCHHSTHAYGVEFLHHILKPTREYPTSRKRASSPAYLLSRAFLSVKCQCKCSGDEEEGSSIITSSFSLSLCSQLIGGERAKEGGIANRWIGRSSESTSEFCMYRFPIPE